MRSRRRFPFLVATQTIGRPLGLALDFLIAVVAAEEMPRNSRAYAVSVLAMASGLGAGVAVLALPLADLSASSLAPRLPRRPGLAGRRRRHRPPAPRDPALRAPARHRPADSTGGRFAVLGLVALLANLFVAPASLFQNGYLEDTRGFSATTIAIFTVATATPAGHRADHRRADRRHPRPAAC